MRGAEVVLYVVDAGGGHRATANALLAAAGQRASPFQLVVKNITDVLAPLDLGRRLTGRSLEDTYNAMVRRQQTRHLVPLLRGFQWLIRGLHPRLARMVTDDLRGHDPCLVLSLFPNFNGVIADAVRMACPNVPFRVLLTDYADFPPHFWMEGAETPAIVATDEAVGQAARAGIPASAVSRVSGMVLHPKFYPAATGQRRQRTRHELDLPADEPVILVLFGGKGSPEMTSLCRALLREAPGVRIVAVCGDNPRLFAEVKHLAAESWGRLRPLGFTDRVPDLMAACDLLLTKPGPGSLAEAFHLRVPVVVCCNAHTIPQERFNVRLVESLGVGLSVEGWPEMAAAAARLIADRPALARLRASLDRLPENRAVYEVLDLIAADVAAASRLSDTA